jgi:hypothetical protein
VRTVAAHFFVSHSNANSTVCMLEDPLGSGNDGIASVELLQVFLQLLLLLLCNQLAMLFDLELLFSKMRWV